MKAKKLGSKNTKQRRQLVKENINHMITSILSQIARRRKRQLQTTRSREKRQRLDYIKCIKKRGHEVLGKDNETNKKWKSYFKKLVNDNNNADISKQLEILVVKKLQLLL